MRPLTDDVPKPLLPVKGKALIDYHLEALVSAGFEEVVINVHHLADEVIEHVGRLALPVRVRFSREEVLLETAGGIRRALPMLGPNPFAVISADVCCDYDYARLSRPLGGGLARLVMVDNPPHHREGDFAIGAGGVLTDAGVRLTYAGIGVFTPAFFDEDAPPGPQKLRALLDPAIAGGRILGEYFPGFWADVGTPERLAALNG